MIFKRAILTHGGAGSNPKNSNGPEAAAAIGMDSMRNCQSSLSAVIHAVRALEDDPRFNAGLGSQLRSDDTSIQLDAACMTSKGDFGAVACIEGLQNPIEIAQEVLLHSPHILLVGDGACQFAKSRNLVMKTMGTVSRPATANCDTVGAIAFDGQSFSTALSSGGLARSPLGRVGDVPLPGCGLYCGPIGAVACTGDGEFIALKILAREVYSWLENKMSPQDAADKAITLFDHSVDIGIIVLTNNSYAANSRNGMAWAHLVETT